MPEIFHRPTDRRSFLQWSALGFATVVSGMRAGAQSGSGAASLKLALLSDTHIPADRMNGHRGFNPWENLRGIVPEVVQSSPEGVIICGDAARLEGREGDYQELRSLLEPIAAKAPVYIALGNHDDRDVFRKVFGASGGSPVSGFEAGGRHVLVVEHEVVRIVILDSLLYVNKVAGHLGRNQREGLSQFLSQNTDRPTVLFVHHTLGDGDGDLLDSDQMFAMLEPHRHVKAIFHGHSHVWAIRARGSLQLINLPAVGYNFRDEDPVGWVQALFRKDGVDLTLHARGGNRSGDGGMTKLRWT